MEAIESEGEKFGDNAIAVVILRGEIEKDGSVCAAGVLVLSH